MTKYLKIFGIGISLKSVNFCIVFLLLTSVIKSLFITKPNSLKMIHKIAPKDGHTHHLASIQLPKSKWGLKSTQTPEAWQIHQSKRKVVVAIIDTGVDIHHPSLAEVIWKNPGESGIDKNGRNKSNNGVDDDKNGFIDDVHGWNFINNSPHLTDRHGHGTHIAGIIAGNHDSSQSAFGVSPHVKLMVLKYFDPKTPHHNSIHSTIQAFEYAIKMGAHIINYSAGGRESHPLERDIIKMARDHNILVVAAAGNEASNADYKHYYPASYDLSNILSVTASNPAHRLLRTSNFGKTTVDLSAPGTNIYSSLPQNKYGVMSGTSQATAIVTGAAALLWSHSPHPPHYQSIKSKLIHSGEYIKDLQGKTTYGSLLNTLRALSMEDQSTDGFGQKNLHKRIKTLTLKNIKKRQPDHIFSKASEKKSILHSLKSIKAKLNLPSNTSSKVPPLKP